MILWTPLPAEQVLEGFDTNTYPTYEMGNVEGIPVLYEKADNGQKRVIRINSSDPAHFLSKEVYPGLITF